VLNSFEKKLVKQGVAVDVVHVHGHLQKYEIFQLINIFCGKIVVGGYHPQALVTTASSEVGVNHRNAQGILNMEMLESISASRQRQGWASRDGQSSWFHIVAGVSSYIMLFKKLLNVYSLHHVHNVMYDIFDYSG